VSSVQSASVHPSACRQQVAIRTASTLIIGLFVVTGFALVVSDSPKAHLALGLAEAFVGDALRAHLRCEH